MKTINLTQEKYAYVDDEDFDYYSQWKWYYSASGYAVRSKNGHQVFLHREIANTPKGYKTDHIDRNKLNNTRENLRTCTDSQNQANTTKKSTNTSGYKGVSLNKQTGRWTAQITVGRKRIHIGYFDFPEDAAQAYNYQAEFYFGEFAELNSI